MTCCSSRMICIWLPGNLGRDQEKIAFYPCFWRWDYHKGKKDSPSGTQYNIQGGDQPGRKEGRNEGVRLSRTRQLKLAEPRFQITSHKSYPYGTYTSIAVVCIQRHSNEDYLLLLLLSHPNWLRCFGFAFPLHFSKTSWCGAVRAYSVEEAVELSWLVL